MNFRIIVILFNAVIGFSFLFMFALPVMALGVSAGMGFWVGNWPLALALLLSLSILDLFFIRNWKMFSLLEREDWPALANHLEKRVLDRRETSPRLVRLLANCYILLSDISSLRTLEKRLAALRPKSLDTHAVIFALARLLEKQPGEAAGFLAQRQAPKSRRAREWHFWYLGFASLLDKDYTASATHFLPIARSGQDAVLVALSAYFLDSAIAQSLPLRSRELQQEAVAAKERLRQRIPGRPAWDSEVNRAKSDICAIVLTRSIDEATAYIFREEPAKEPV